MADIDQKDLGALCAAVGFLTINWALMERHMDNIIHLSFFTLGGIPGYDSKPREFTNKASYLAQAFAHTKEFAPHKTNALSLIERARTFSIARHAFTHGTLESLDGTVLTINKLQGKQEYLVDRITIDTIDFPAHAQEIGGLVTGWLTLSKTLLDEHQKRKQQHESDH